MVVEAILIPIGVVSLVTLGCFSIYKRYRNKRAKKTRSIFNTLTPHPFDPVYCPVATTET